MEPTGQTLYFIRSPDRGLVAAVGRRQVRDFFGNEFFRYVGLIERKFKGFDYHGAKELRWSGVPVLCCSFPHRLFPDELLLRPRLDVFPIKVQLTQEEDWPDITAAFDTIRSEWDQFISMPETARLHRRVLLFTVEENKLKTYRSEG